MKGLLKVLIEQPTIRQGATPIAGPDEFIDDAPTLIGGNDGGDESPGSWSDYLGSTGLGKDKDVSKSRGGFVYLEDEGGWTQESKDTVEAAKQDADDFTRDYIMVTIPNENNKDEQTVVLAGYTKPPNEKEHQFKIEQNSNGEWGWINDADENINNPQWEKFEAY